MRQSVTALIFFFAMLALVLAVLGTQASPLNRLIVGAGADNTNPDEPWLHCESQRGAGSCIRAGCDWDYSRCLYRGPSPNTCWPNFIASASATKDKVDVLRNACIDFGCTWGPASFAEGEPWGTCYFARPHDRSL